MKRLIVLSLVIILLLSLNLNMAGAKTKADISGKWETNWGALYLSQIGNKVIGTYDYQHGRIEGTIVGNKFKYTWSQFPSYTNKYDKGTGYFTIENKKSISGKWKFVSSKKWEGDWVAVRIVLPKKN